jgi:hypothetical protein
LRAAALIETPVDQTKKTEELLRAEAMTNATIEEPKFLEPAEPAENRLASIETDLAEERDNACHRADIRAPTSKNTI